MGIGTHGSVPMGFVNGARPTPCPYIARGSDLRSGAFSNALGNRWRGGLALFPSFSPSPFPNFGRGEGQRGVRAPRLQTLYALFQPANLTQTPYLAFDLARPVKRPLAR